MAITRDTINNVKTKKDDTMNKFTDISIYVADSAFSGAAEAFSARTKIPLSDAPSDGLTILFDRDGISLTGYSMRFQCDFSGMLRRITGGRINHEMLIRAAKTKTENPKAIDATAGMGEDSFLLAAYGYDVTMYEQNEVIALLLKDALRRAKKNPLLEGAASRMHLIEGNSIDRMSSFSDHADLIYLDPMFPARKKSGLIGKKLQLIQKLESPCENEEALLLAAMALDPKKIIIKRPLKGDFLAGKKPDYTIRGKAIRYDCFSR